MKQCNVFNKGLCTGCVGLAEADWIGPERCSTYKQLSNISGLDLCKSILEGKQIKL